MKIKLTKEQSIEYDKMMRRYGELRGKPTLTYAEKLEFNLLLENYMQWEFLLDPEGFRERYKEYKVDTATYEKMKGKIGIKN